VSQPKAEKLDAIRHAMRIALVHAPLTPETVAAANAALDAAHRAPRFLTSFPEMREVLSLAQGRLPANGLVVIGTGLEAEWVAAGRLGAFLTAERYFGT
jgi:hypothetical protein